MKHAGPALLTAALVACVPATDPKDPHGGLRLSLVANAATNGESFVTSDGWTVTFEQVAVRAQPGADSIGGESNVLGISRVVNPRVPCDVDLVAIPAGRANISMVIAGAYPSNVTPELDNACGLTPEIAARFEAFADNAMPTAPDENGFGDGPAFVVIGHATSGGQTIRFDLALSSFNDYGDGQYLLDACNDTPDAPECLDRYNYAPPTEGPSTVTIVANQGSPFRFSFHADTLFTDLDGVSRFSWFGIADTNGNADGVVTANELQKVSIKCEPPYYDDSGAEVGDPECATALDLFTKNSLSMIDKVPLTQ